MGGGRVSGGPVSFDCTKFMWNGMGIIDFKRASGKLLGEIRVVITFNREHRSTGRVLEGWVKGSWNMFIQLEELPKATRRVHYSVLLAD